MLCRFVASVVGQCMKALPMRRTHETTVDADLLIVVMQIEQAKPLELAYTALARMAATAGDGDAAVEAINRGLQAGVPPKIRGFVPALLAYAVAGETEKAFQVHWRCHSCCDTAVIVITMFSLLLV